MRIQESAGSGVSGEHGLSAYSRVSGSLLDACPSGGGGYRTWQDQGETGAPEERGHLSSSRYVHRRVMLSREQVRRRRRRLPVRVLALTFLVLFLMSAGAASLAPCSASLAPCSA